MTESQKIGAQIAIYFSRQIAAMSFGTKKAFANYLKSLKNSSCPTTPFDAFLVLGDGSQFPVHKLVLAANSGFFNRLLSYESQLIRINDVSNDVMSDILDFFYGNQFSDDFFADLSDRNGNGRRKLEIIGKRADFFLAKKLQAECKKIQAWLQWTDNKSFPFQCPPYSRGHYLQALKSGGLFFVPE